MVGAVSSADLSERPAATNDDGLKHRINLPLEIRGPPARRLGGGFEERLEIEGGVERRVHASVVP